MNDPTIEPLAPPPADPAGPSTAEIGRAHV